MLIGVAILIAIYLLWVVVLWFLQDSLVFPRAWAAARAGPLDREGTELLLVPSDEGDVPAWFFRGAGVDDDHPAGVVVLLHGNEMCIDDWFDEATALAAYGFNVLLPEYRGYGNAPGTPSQSALTQDVSAFVDLVRERGDVVGDKIVYYGRSIGSALAAQVAVQRKPAGLVLHTPPTSIARYAMRYGAPPILIKHPFRTAKVLPGLGDVAILIIAHSEDTLVDPSQPRRLMELAPHAEFLEVGGTHNGFASREDEEVFRSARLRFLRELFAQ